SESSAGAGDIWSSSGNGMSCRALSTGPAVAAARPRRGDQRGIGPVHQIVDVGWRHFVGANVTAHGRERHVENGEACQARRLDTRPSEETPGDLFHGIVDLLP